VRPAWYDWHLTTKRSTRRPCELHGRRLRGEAEIGESYRQAGGAQVWRTGSAASLTAIGVQFAWTTARMAWAATSGAAPVRQQALALGR